MKVHTTAHTLFLSSLSHTLHLPSKYLLLTSLLSSPLKTLLHHKHKHTNTNPKPHYLPLFFNPHLHTPTSLLSGMITKDVTHLSPQPDTTAATGATVTTC